MSDLLQQPIEQLAARALPGDPVLLCAADENYVRPLTVMLHSAAMSMRVGNQLNVVLFDGGISESSLEGIAESLRGLSVSLSVIRPGLNDVSDLVTSHHITHTAYLRLLAARLLPREIEKVIYLDSDVMVRDDLTELWEMPLGDNYCLAVTDVSCPFVDAREVRDSEIQAAKPYMNALQPIGNWQQLGLDGAANYFNSGVMVLNLDKWRRDGVEEKLLRCLRENEAYVWCWDQYALNVVFAGRWGRLPLRWNQGAHAFEYPNAKLAPFDSDEFLAMRDRPAIVHFTTEFKPWDFESTHPLRSRFYEQLDQTAFGGWRPDDPGFRFRSWMDRKVIDAIRAWLIQWRKFKLMFAQI